MADKEIAMLPMTFGVTDDTIIPVYQPGAMDPAQHMTGAQLREWLTAEPGTSAGNADCIIDVTQMPIPSYSAEELPNLTKWAATGNAGEYSWSAYDDDAPIPEGHYTIKAPDGKMYAFYIPRRSITIYDEFVEHRVELLWNSADGLSGTETFEYNEYDRFDDAYIVRTVKSNLQFSGELNENAFYRMDGNLYFYTPGTAKRLATEDDVNNLPGGNGNDGFSPIATVTQTDDGAFISITDKDGTTTATITNGKDGSKGDTGKDGTSVTVASVSESTADGGSNVVTFSDGKTVTIKNGKTGATGTNGTSVTVSNVSESSASGGTNTVTFSDGKKVNIKNGINGTNGKDGKTPVKGTDYWTEADKTSMIQDVIVALGGTPVFGVVDAQNNIIITGNLANGTYTLKFEDLEGNVTEIGKVVVGDSYTNQIPISTDTDGSVYNTTGYKTASRISSSGGISNVNNTSASNPAFVTGFIPCRRGDIIRLANCFIDTDGTGSDTSYYGQDIGGLRVAVYDASKSFLAAAAWSEYASSGLLENYTVGENGYITEFGIKNANCAFVRLCLGGDPETAIVTINEEITD